MSSPHSKQWREEKVFLIFVPHGAGLKARSGEPAGDWVVHPGLKPASPGQTITWKTIPDAKLELLLPDVFEPPHATKEGEASAKVRDEAANGLYFYEAYCNGQLATGGSAPGVIIDP